MRQKFLLPVLIFMSLIFASRWAAAAERRDLAATLPTDALVIVRARDMSALLRQWPTSPLARLVDDPRAALFFKPLQEAVADFRAMTGRRQLDAPAAFGNFLSGELVLAGIPAPDNAKDPIEWIWLYEHKADPPTLARLAQPPVAPGATVRQTAEKAGNYTWTRTETIREVEAAIPVEGGKSKHKKKDLIIPEAEAAPLTLKQQVVKQACDYFGPDLVVHTGSSRPAMEQILGRLGSDAPADTTGGLLNLRPTVGPDSDLEVYVNGEALAFWLQDQAHRGKWDQWADLSALRLGEIKTAAAAFKFEPGRLAVNLALRAPEPRAGASRLLMMGGAAPSDLASLVPAGALAYTGTVYPLADFARATLQLLPQISPLAGPLVQFQLKQFESATGANFDRDIVGSLGKQCGRFLLPVADAAGPQDLVTEVVALSDPATLRTALPRLLDYGARSLGAYTVEPGKAGEWPLWTIYTGRPEANATHGPDPVLQLCIADKWLLASPRIEGINAFVERLKANGPALASQAGFKALQDRLPAERYGEFWQSPAGLREALALVLPEPGKGHGKGKGKNRSGLFDLDPSLLPDAAVFAQSISGVSGALSRAGDLLQVRGFVNYPQ